MTKEKLLEAVEYDNAVRMVRVETEERAILFPYISYRLGILKQRDQRQNTWHAELTFDQGIVTLAGQNFDEFIRELQCERVSVIRAGKSEAADGPEIRSVQVHLHEESKQDGSSNL